MFSLVLQLQREKRWAFEEEDEEDEEDDDDDDDEFFFYVSRYSSRGVVGVVGVLRER